MAKKLRTGIRAAPKVQEKELIRKAEALRTRPEAVLPRCLPEACPRCPFDGLLRRLEGIAGVAENEGRLESLAKRGPPLARAYAATLLVALQGKAPYLAPAKTPYGTVNYVVRGKAPQEQLVGVQYHDVPELRLLTVGAWARRKGLHVYSLESEMVTTCREDRPPEAFVKETLARTGVALHRVGDEYACPHASEEPAVVVGWKGAGVKVVLCRRCHPPKGSFPSLVGQRMAVPSLGASFEVALRPTLRCHGEACSFAQDRPLPQGTTVQDYLKGELDEAGLLEKEAEDLVEEIAQAEGLFVVGSECFEDDYAAFLGALKASEDLLPALQSLEDELGEGMVLSEASVTKFVEALDDDRQRSLLDALLEDEEMADALLQASEAEERGADAMLAEALKIRKDLDVVARLPAWGALPPVARLVDATMRAFRTKGRDEAALAAGRGLQGRTAEKAVAMALLQALDEAAGKEWMVRGSEKELADFLTPMARDLMEADGEAYAEGLQRLLTASGSGETLPGR